MTDIHETIRLAQAFGEQVQTAFGPAQFREICYLNKSSHASTSICATHDFCDANMLMEAAFQATFGRESDVADEADAKVWSDAWAIAKAAEFFA